MADRTAAKAFGMMFCLAASKSKPNKALGRLLWEEAARFDFSPYQTGAGGSIVKLGLVTDPEDRASLESHTDRPCMAPRTAFSAMKQVLQRDANDSNADNFPAGVNQAVSFSKKLAYFTPLFGIAPGAILIEGPAAAVHADHAARTAKPKLTALPSSDDDFFTFDGKVALGVVVVVFGALALATFSSKSS